MVKGLGDSGSELGWKITWLDSGSSCLMNACKCVTRQPSNKTSTKLSVEPLQTNTVPPFALTRDFSTVNFSMDLILRDGQYSHLHLRVGSHATRDSNRKETIRVSRPGSGTTLLILPAELRNRIYEYALVEREPIQLWPSPTSFEPRFRHVPGLLSANRQVRAETIPIFYYRNSFATGQMSRVAAMYEHLCRLEVRLKKQLLAARAHKDGAKFDLCHCCKAFQTMQPHDDLVEVFVEDWAEHWISSGYNSIFSRKCFRGQIEWMTLPQLRWMVEVYKKENGYKV